MKSLLILFLPLILITSAMAQNAGFTNVSGKITDAQNNGIDGATVSLL
ncbi:MAG: hypothetical protein ABJA76_13250 [Mucilaginibacter sp.]